MGKSKAIVLGIKMRKMIAFFLKFSKQNTVSLLTLFICKFS